MLYRASLLLGAASAHARMHAPTLYHDTVSSGRIIAADTCNLTASGSRECVGLCGHCMHLKK